MRVVIFAILFLLIGYIQKTESSSLTGPVCFVKAKVVNIGSEKRKLDSGKNYESPCIDLEILEVSGERLCPVSKSQVYRAIDNHPGIFKVGDMIVAGIEIGSSLGPAGPVNFLQWSKVIYENGSSIVDKNKHNMKIDFLQSADKPINQN